MHFDNFVKSNPSNVPHKFDPSPGSVFHHQPLNAFEPIQFNQRPFFNPRTQENNSVPSPAISKNSDQPQKHYPPYQTGSNPPYPQRQQPYQPKNTISFNNELPNSANNRENTEFVRRRDSISQNAFLRSQQGHSPSNTKGNVGENGAKNNGRMTINNEQQRNMQYGHKNNGSSNNLSNFGGNGFNEQDYGMNLLLNKDKVQQKPGYFNSSNYNQYGFSESRVGSKPYALGFKSGLEAIDLDSRKGMESLPKDKPLQQKEMMYNYQLKNTINELTSFSKPNQNGADEYKYYTPSLAKKSSLKDDSITINKNGYSQVVDVRHNNNMLEREGNNVKENGTVLTDREMQKSPSFDTLLAGTGTKDNFKNKQHSIIENHSQHQYASSTPTTENNHKHYSQHTITPRNNNSNILIDNQPYTTGSKPTSESFIADQTAQKLPKTSTKNYHALIENLQKKFSEQKKSHQTFENKEKSYILEINKRQQKIKRQQTIIENNKETISALDQTIQQLRKKLDNASKEDSSKADSVNSSNLSMIEELKRQNGGLKEELKKQRKKSVTIAEQSFQKEILQRQEMKLKELQKALIQANNNRQALSLQVVKLKDANTSIQQNYCHEIKQHQKTKQELKQFQKTKQELKDYQRTKQELQRIKSQSEQLVSNLKEKTDSYNQLKAMLQNLEQKYEGSLKKIVSLEEELDEQISKFKERIESERKDKQIFVDETQKLRTRLERLQGEIDFKSMKIKTLEEKLSQKQTEIQNTISAHHKAICSNQSSVNETISICLEETKMAKQRLSLKQQAYEGLSHELSEKNKQIEQLLREKSQNLNKIASLEIQIQGLEFMVAQQEAKIEQNFKATSDSAEMKTLSSQFGRQSTEFKEIQTLLEVYHEKYSEVVAIFNIGQSNQEKSHNHESEHSMIVHHQHLDHVETLLKAQPSREYLNQYHPILTDEAKKILKDMKKLLNVLKECEADSQLKTQRLHELDKTLKKQANKINQLIGEIHLKNMTIVEINNMQVQKDIFRLNEKYQILNCVGL